MDRSRKTWLKEIQQAIRELGIRVWRRSTQDKSNWVMLVRQSLAQHKPFFLLDFFIRIWTFKIYKTIILPLVLYGYETWSFT